jgi:hypothetical protein
MPSWWFNDNEQVRPAALRKICQSSSRAADLARALADAVQGIDMSLVTAQKPESAFGEGFVSIALNVAKGVERP